MGRRALARVDALWHRAGMSEPRPVIGVLADRRQRAEHAYHRVEESYLEAVLHGAAAQPLVLPVLAGDAGMAELLDGLDGILLPGSPSNVEPWRYRQPLRLAGTLQDPERDAVALELIPAALAAGVPLLAICRGFQELNVALGGSLHQALEAVPGMIRHRLPAARPLAERYAPSHELRFTRGGLLERIGGRAIARVNSVHSQGVDRLAEALVVEAVAPDGLVEACVVRDAPAFALGVQWHPEWNLRDDPLSAAIFRAFGAAARGRADTRRRALRASGCPDGVDATSTDRGNEEP